MDQDHNKHLIAVTALVKNEKGQTLLVRTHSRSDTWESPGGRVEKGERLDEAIRREFKEETGITIRPIGITGVYHNPINQILTVVFYAEYVSGEIEIQSNELIEAKFLELNEQNIDQYVTRNYIKASLLHAMKANHYLPYETWSI